MLLKQFYSVDGDHIRISAEQASTFAKEIAHDFNPLHDVDAKRFCVPGDLLFSLVLEKYGLSQHMQFVFSGMVGDAVPLRFPADDGDSLDVTDGQGKTCLQIQRSGPVSRDSVMIEALIRDYVAFSGQNFPYVLVPLLAKENIMFNIDRPLVIYESMTITMSRVDFHEPKLETLEPKMEANGKRATAFLHFQIRDTDEIVGSGFKKLAVSGLREYEDQPMQDFVNDYLARKHGYLGKLAQEAV
ncbi:MAG: hypothetical protein CTY22_08405 [Methylomonas sp.]|nr:MAG: hypothetical protein CTY23_03325 [Methylomonas sp.]PPD25495.1 MAG: hypothetical protein CTY22_08405 [Methylomonas sp.]PPD36291.1 MAG: hypothetical protein CTY21_08410 [Methylomonas sp.]PPD42416.1 MAG: hypothetical protein CTY17_01345 [Methylomonas sp.]PPD53126.1 MAG: hypothetical protein CTY11_07425 [Methylomonas sp.]